jgi:hypothetical protein
MKEPHARRDATYTWQASFAALMRAGATPPGVVGGGCAGRAKRLEMTGAGGEPLVPEMTEAERLAAIEALLACVQAR